MKFPMFLMLLCTWICHGNEIWYQSEISTHLEPSFRIVYKTMQQDIINKLLTIDSKLLTTNQAAMTSFSSDLYCEMEKFIQNIAATAAASSDIRTMVENKLNNITEDISNKESEIARLETQLRGIHANIQGKQSQITVAEESVQQAETSVLNAQNELYGAEKEVEAAKLCAGLFGKRKRFLDTLWKPMDFFFIKPMEFAMNTAGGMMVNGFVKPVCSVINYQKVDDAKKNVESKKHELTFFRNLVETYKNDLTSIQSDLTTYSAQLNNLNYELNQLKSSLTQLPVEQHLIVSIDQKLTNTASYIRTLFYKSTSFIDIVKKVIDFEYMIKPLNAVYDELKQNQFIGAFNFDKISSAQVDQAKAKLQGLTSAKFSVTWNVENIRCSK